MERIKLVYDFDYDECDNAESKTIRCERYGEDGLHDYEVCEMFMDFMRSCGFSEENIIKYFTE